MMDDWIIGRATTIVPHKGETYTIRGVRDNPMGDTFLLFNEIRNAPIPLKLRGSVETDFIARAFRPEAELDLLRDIARLARAFEKHQIIQNSDPWDIPVMVLPVGFGSRKLKRWTRAGYVEAPMPEVRRTGKDLA